MDNQRNNATRRRRPSQEPARSRSRSPSRNRSRTSRQRLVPLLKMLEQLADAEDNHAKDAKKNKILQIIRTKNFKKDEVDSNGSTPLIYAIGNLEDDLDIALELIRSGISKPDVIDGDGNTALIYACDENMDEVALKLINTGHSNPGVQDDEGKTALIYAINNDMEDVALALINTGQSNPGVKDNNGNTALLLACENDKSDIALALISTGQSNPGATSNDGYTALMFACGGDTAEMSQVALEILKTADPNVGAISDDHFTALINACDNEKTEVALEIIKTGKSNPYVLNDEDQNTALSIACENRMTEVALEIIKTGQSNFESVNSDGHSALMIAKHNGMDEVVQAIENEYIVYINEDGRDFIKMETTKIQDYLQENNDGLCFKIENQYYLLKKQYLIMQLNDENHIKHGCKKVGNDAHIYADDNNIIFEIQYLSLASIFGMQFVVKMEDVRNILDNPYSTQVYVALFANILPGLISVAYIDGDDGESSDHCQTKKETPVYSLRPGKVKCHSSTAEEQAAEDFPVPNPNITLKLQYKGFIFEFDIENQSIAIGEIKQILLDKLRQEGHIETKNQNVKFIYKGRVYRDDAIRLREIESESNNITLQSMVTPISGGRKTRKIHKK